MRCLFQLGHRGCHYGRDWMLGYGRWVNDERWGWRFLGPKPRFHSTGELAFGKPLTIAQVSQRDPGDSRNVVMSPLESDRWYVITTYHDGTVKVSRSEGP